MTDHDHISDLRWDRLFAGELPADQRDATHAHTAGCPRCGARYRELEAERAAFVLRPIGVRFPAPAPARRSWWTWSTQLGGLAAAAALVIVFVVGRQPAVPGERTKGGDGPILVLGAGRPEALRPVGAGDAIHPGEYLQAGYTAKHAGFGAVLSLDGAGHAMAYVGGPGDAMVALPAGTDRSFPGSTVLDEVIGLEQIAILWCAAPRPLAPLLEELRSTRQLAPREGCTIRLLALDKQARR